MSYGLNLFLVDPALVRGIVGSGDEKQRRMMGGRFKRELAQDDAWFADRIAEGAPPAYEALRAVIDGGPFEEEHAFQYAYAYQRICEFHGRRLDNSSFSPFRYGWLGRVDEALAELGVTAVEVTSFTYRDFPAPLPRPEELPGHGVWSTADCARALKEWEAATPDLRAALDPEVREAVESIAGWLRRAAAKPGAGVLGFFS
ncbi:hypothetical protein ACFV5N_18595 [Streptomyces sp. NPDC059853]|uniref:DUF7691 family protein n=1 Tax=Streptomyces sp. NPDC059853 TaxID=3346973 RepID=UPI0036672F0C